MIYSVKLTDKDETNRTIEFKIDDYTNDAEMEQRKMIEMYRFMRCYKLSRMIS